MRNARSNSVASPSRRSRVTPGWSSTSASFLPTRRLNSVDLPTLGRPTMATVGRFLAIAGSPSGSAPGGQPTLGVEKIERVVGDDRRQIDRGAIALGRLHLSGQGRYIDDLTARACQYQSPVRQHRSGPADGAVLVL